jgi:hypothetical protein
VDIQVLGTDSTPEPFALVRVPRLRMELQCDSNGTAQLIIPNDFQEDKLVLYFDSGRRMSSMFTLESSKNISKVIIQLDQLELKRMVGVIVVDPIKKKKK